MEVEIEITLKNKLIFSEKDLENKTIEELIDNQIKLITEQREELNNVLINSSMEKIEVLNIDRKNTEEVIKYYEVRYNPLTKKLTTNVRNNSYDRQRHSIETNENITQHFDKTTIDGIELYRPYFDGFSHKIEDKQTYSSLMKSFPQIISNLSKHDFFYWLIADSSHRKDAYLVDEYTFNKLLDNDLIYDNLRIVEEVDHIFSNHDNSIKQKEILVTKAIHKLGELDLFGKEVTAIVSEEDDENYYGSLKDIYLNYIDIKFPKNGVI
jgi:hypothetical protein